MISGDDDKTPTDDDEDRTQIAPQSPPKKAAEEQPETIILPEEVPAAPRPDVKADAEADAEEDISVPIPPGTMINNNYEIIELISAGGMGEVFRGENAFTGDAVAIKIVLNSLANDEKVAALFMREAKVLCQLSDQAIVRYYNFVKDTNLDRFCLIMEFVDGVPLAQEMREKGPLSSDQCKNLIRRLASGLDRAHSMEVVHRDLSPDNVILRDGKIENAVLIDFGIAKSAMNVESTLHGQLAGKFKYISPEQLGHFGGEVGPRTDIYGLGLLIAAAARGEPLDMGTTVVEAVNARQAVPDLTGVDPEIRGLLTRMLQPDPADRPARMADLVRMLDSPVPDMPPITTQNPTTMRPAATPVPGLREPPGRTGGPTTLRGSLETTGTSDSTSPFEARPATIAPVTLVPETESAAQNKSSAAFIVVLLATLAAGGGFFAWSQGLFSEGAGIAAGGNVGGTPSNQIGGPPDPSTREGFLALQSQESCVYATRISSGPNSGVIRALATETNIFNGLADAYDDAFGARPSIFAQAVAPPQCPALNLADGLRAMGGTAPILTLDNTEMVSGGSLVGRISNRGGRTVWLALVSAAGGVYNLTDRMTEQSDGSATFNFGLQAEAGADPTPQLLIAVASDSPLIAASAATDGTSAETLLPLIEAEIAGRTGANAGASIGVFLLSP